MQDFSRERALAAQLAREAGHITLKHRRPEGVAFTEKPDDEGPVTAADKEADRHIRAGILSTFPTDGLLTEETPDTGEWRNQHRVWMVDPLDGTKEFVAGRDEYASMIGLCVDGEPVVGAVYRPLGDVMFLASKGGGAEMIVGGKSVLLRVSDEIPNPVPIAVSRSHRSKRVDAILGGLGPVKEVPSGSVGLKIGLIANGTVHAYVNGNSRTSLWDTCAPHAILTEAGGELTDLFGNPLDYKGSVQHLYGLFAATAAVHKHLVPRVREMSMGVVKMLQELPEYPRNAFRPPP
ncbi:MAG: 3'(2'),5'-bisphosphate nucleotidase CysQ [Myxococcota bacterium]